MEHYLVVVVQYESDYPMHRKDRGKLGLVRDYQASLLAFDLLGHSVQEAEIDGNRFTYADNYSFIKYGENQILKFCNSMSSYESFVCITVESFKRNICFERA